MKLTKRKLQAFCTTIWGFYRAYGREFAWRNVDSPYCVVVSEIMLQQTQTYRVAPKYNEFIEAFPSFDCLAAATLRDVLVAWQGLGYNRRGKYLYEIAQKVMDNYAGILPDDPALLAMFPGIGPATASSIVAFAFNKPTVFIETNIRSVFIHHFFNDKEKVHDKELMPFIAATVDKNNPREWYYALMDYGVMLKKNSPNPSRKSAHHTMQTKFEGSDRQIRGMVIKYLTEYSACTLKQLCATIPRDPERIKRITDEMKSEKLIQLQNGYYSI